MRGYAARWLPIAVFALGWSWAGSLRELLLLRGPWPSGLAFTFLGIWLSWHVLIVLHEAAHALVALVLGGTLHQVAAGPITARRHGGRWSVRRRPMSLFEGGHLVVAFPRGGGAHRRRALVHLAGPASALLVAAAAWGALSRPWALERAAGLLLRLVLVVAAGSLLMSGVPGFWRTGKNDADLFADALRGGFWYGNTGSQLAIHLWARDRAREWSPTAAEIERASREEGEPTGWGLLLAASRALDAGEHAAARRLLEELATSPAATPEIVDEALVQLGLCAALVDGDAERARSWLARSGWSGKEYGRICEAAALLAEGRREEARASYACWDAHVAARSDPALARLGNHWAIDAITARLG